MSVDLAKNQLELSMKEYSDGSEDDDDDSEGQPATELVRVSPSVAPRILRSSSSLPFSSGLGGSEEKAGSLRGRKKRLIAFSSDPSSKV